MATIKNIEGLSMAQLQQEINNGGKFVVFHYCISILIMTFKRGSNIYFIRSGESTFSHSIPYTILSLALGWWGIPWGPIHTISSLYTNITGGKDMTAEVMNAIGAGRAKEEITDNW
jgi:hypothetical protein